MWWVELLWLNGWVCGWCCGFCRLQISLFSWFWFGFYLDLCFGVCGLGLIAGLVLRIGVAWWDWL